MEADLKRWSLKIDRLVAKTELVGAHPSFDTLTYIDELKALHAVARSKLETFKARGDRGGARLEAELELAWKEADAAFKKPKPRTSGAQFDSEADRRLRQCKSR